MSLSMAETWLQYWCNQADTTEEWRLQKEIICGNESSWMFMMCRVTNLSIITSCGSQAEEQEQANVPATKLLTETCVGLGHAASFCLPGKDKWKIEQWKYKSSQRGISCNRRMPLIPSCLCVWESTHLDFCFSVSLVETLCSFFFHSSTVCCCCQLADSCFIILFQNLNPKKWARKEWRRWKDSAYYCTQASPLHLTPAVVEPRGLGGGFAE